LYIGPMSLGQHICFCWHTWYTSVYLCTAGQSKCVWILLEMDTWKIVRLGKWLHGNVLDMYVCIRPMGRWARGQKVRAIARWWPAKGVQRGMNDPRVRRNVPSMGVVKIVQAQGGRRLAQAQNIPTFHIDRPHCLCMGVGRGGNAAKKRLPKRWPA